MVRRNTWMLLGVLLALVAFSFYLRQRQGRESASPTPTGAMPRLFSGDGDPTRIRVEGSQGLVVELSRGSGGNWILVPPQSAEADQAAAEAAATQVGALRVLSTVELDPGIIGLDKPDYTITIGFGGGQEHKLLVGSITPIQDGYYVRLDDGPFQVVDKFGLDELTGLLANPPFRVTATPEASATAIAPTTISSGTPPAAIESAAPSSTPEQATATPAP